MGSRSFGFSLDMRRLRFSPLGELLSFASPKESNQRKGDPTSLPCGFPIWRVRAGAPPTRPGTGHKTPRAAELGHGSAFSPQGDSDFLWAEAHERSYAPPARAKSAALKGNNPGCRSRVMPTLRQAQAHARAPLVCRREAQPAEEKRGWVFELRSRARFVCPARASSSPASGGEHRRGAEGRHTRGGLFFGDFLLATQKKATRPQAKREALAKHR